MYSGLHYSDIALIPKRSSLNSRANADLSVEFGRTFKLPVVPSNMACAISFEKAEWLAANGYFYILHRFYGAVSILKWLKTSSAPFHSISIGVQNIDKLLIETIVKEKLRLDYVTIDVAHGHHNLVFNMINFLRAIRYANSLDFKIIAGNIATEDAYYDMSLAGVDAVKVGIAYGAACITYHKTGFASPMFSVLQDIGNSSRYHKKGIKKPQKPFIIADGGIHNNGDIAKALVAGANMVMCGSLFAGCVDSPAQFHPIDKTQKLYFGSASEFNGNEKNIEGKIVSIPCNNMTYEEKLQEIQEDLSSAVSYAGGNNIKSLKNVNYYIVNR